MYNVFSYRQANGAGIDERLLRTALQCCLLRISRGVFAVVIRCENPAHQALQRWADYPDDLAEPVGQTAEPGDPRAATRENSAHANPGARHHPRTNPGTRHHADRPQPTGRIQPPTLVREKMSFGQLKRLHLGTIAARGLREGQFLSHRSAALAQGVPLADSRVDRIEVCHPEGLRETTAAQRRRRRHVPDEFLTDACRSLPGIPMTNPLWTIADLMRDASALDGFVAADAYVGALSDSASGMLRPYPGDTLPPTRQERLGRQAEHLRLLTAFTDERRRQLENVLDRLEAMVGHRGMVGARRLLSQTTGMAESAFESLTLLALRQLVTSEIRQQVVFEHTDGPRYDRVDFFLPDHRIIIESDGWQKYSTFGPKAQESMRRDRRLAKHGTVLHIEWRDVMPGRHGYRLARLLREAGVRV